MKFGCTKSVWCVFSIAVLVAVSAKGDLVGRWSFDEGSGTTATDSSGSGYSGTITGAAYVAGQVGSGALSFDGLDDHVDVGYHAPLALAGSNYTVAWWMNRSTDVTTANFRIINMDDGSDQSGGYSFLLGGGNSLALSHANGSNNQVNTGYAPPQNAWAHVAVVYGGLGIGRTLYVDGFPLANYDINGTPILDDGDDPLWFGGMPVHGQYWAGTLDDIQIYNQALTEAEVGIVMSGGVIGDTSLSGDYDGDEDVDGDDLTAWKNQFAVSPVPAAPNADGDESGNVDGNDFLIWQRGFGGLGGPGASSIPEPDASTLAIVLAFGCVAFRKIIPCHQSILLTGNSNV